MFFQHMVSFMTYYGMKFILKSFFYSNQALKYADYTTPYHIVTFRVIIRSNASLINATITDGVLYVCN